MFKFRKLIVISITSILFIFFSNAYAESVQEIIASAQKAIRMLKISSVICTTMGRA